MTKQIINFRGLMPILPSTRNADGAIDERDQRRLVRYALDCGAVAIGHFGIASEFAKLSPGDRAVIARTVVDEVNGKVPVFLGVTASSATGAAEFARAAEDAGADILMLGVPFPIQATQAEVYDYFAAVARATPLPIIIQDTIPAGSLLSPDLCVRMFEEFETICYCKAEGAEFVTKTKQLIERTDGRMGVIGGAGGQHMLSLLRAGVTSFMTGTEWIDLHAAIIRDFLAGDEDAAMQKYFEVLLPYFAWYSVYPDQLLKDMLYRRGVIEHPRMLPPRGKEPMPSAEYAEYEWTLAQLNFPATRPMSDATRADAWRSPAMSIV